VLLRMLLNGGTADGDHRLLTGDSVAAMTVNQIGDLTAQRQRSAFTDRTLDFGFMDGTQKFGFGVLIETRDRDGGRRAGSYGWGGIFNTYYWVDPAAGIAAVLMMQLAPFCDAGCLDVYRRVERAVYRSLA
jgi:methyl acetate hydrolase